MTDAIAFGIAGLVILLCSLVPNCDANACPKYAAQIEMAAKAHGVPAGLLSSLCQHESSCRPWVRNKRTGAIGLCQILPGGSAAHGFPAEALWHIDLNIVLASAHLKKWRRRCGYWAGAVRVYHGNGKCSHSSEWSDRVIEHWRMRNG